MNAKSPSKDFFDDLERSDKPTLRKFTALFERWVENGRINNKEQFKKVDGSIWEFKRYQHRVGCFQDGPDLVLTHGFVKKQSKWPKAELLRAERIRSEDLVRKARRNS